MIKVLKANGGNNYKNPHHGRRRLERLGLLQIQVELEQHVLDAARQHLNEWHIEANQSQ